MSSKRVCNFHASRSLPRLRLNGDVTSIFDFQYEDFQLENYDPHPHIPPVAV